MENLIGTSEENMEKATGEVGKEFEPLAAGCYKGKVKDIMIYVNNFGSNSMRYVVTVTTKDGEERDLQFINDINSKLKGDADNVGYANRYKQFVYATNVDESTLSKKTAAGKLNSFGKEYEYDALLGMTDKALLVEVKLRNDTTKAEGAAFKYSNTINGVLAQDGTDSTGENKAEKFNAKVEKTPVEDYEGYVKGGNSATQAKAKDGAAAEAGAEDF